MSDGFLAQYVLKSSAQCVRSTRTAQGFPLRGSPLERHKWIGVGYRGTLLWRAQWRRVSNAVPQGQIFSLRVSSGCLPRGAACATVL